MPDILAVLNGVSPAWFLIVAGLLAWGVPWSPVRKALMLIGPCFALLAWFATHETGVYGVIDLGPFQLETFRFDSLSRIWVLVFILIAFINGVYALHERNRMTDGAALIYAGAAVGAVLSGDLLTLFFFWELTALASAPLIFAAGAPMAHRAGLRYLAIQVLSGVLLLAGAAVWASQTGSWGFDAIGADSAAGVMLLLAFGVKAGFPLLHMWLPDAYPKATGVGSVVLSAFTTKLAVYALARGFAGEGALIAIGLVMAVFPIVFALVSNDLRQTLAYALINQLGFMVVGVGLGNELALNGAAANAFVGVIYMALMFMTLGAVLHRTGTVKATELGGLFKSMPVTGMCAIIGALSVAGAPLFSGFVAKTLILSGAHYAHNDLAYAILVYASAGVMELSVLKVVYCAFFGEARHHQVREAPQTMLLGMALAAFLCVYLGVDYRALYELLPFGIDDYEPYKLNNVFGQVQLLLGGAFVFALAVGFKLFPLKSDHTILDADWFYRCLGDGAARWGKAMGELLVHAINTALTAGVARLRARLFNLFNPAGALSREFPSGLMALWTAIMLAAVLLVSYFSPMS